MYFCWAYNMLQALRQEAGDQVLHRISIDAATGQCSLQNLSGIPSNASSGFTSDNDEYDMGDGSDNRSEDSESTIGSR